MSKPVILFTISNGWGIRNFGNTGIFAKVSKFAKIGVSTTSELMPFFVQNKDKFNISYLQYLPPNETNLWKLVRRVKKFILQSRFQISTAQIKSRYTAKNNLTAFLKVILWKFSRIFTARWQIKIVEKIEGKFKTSNSCGETYPDILIVGEPFDNRDQQLQRELHFKGVGSIAVIPSWDNPSTKGVILSYVKKVFVWGEIQKEELINYYPTLKDDKIVKVGIPQFDVYREQFILKIDKFDFLGQMSIANDKKIILYATCPETLFPKEPDVILDIADAMSSKNIDGSCHLLVRLHPKDRMDRYTKLITMPNVTLFSPSISDGGGEFSWRPASDELLNLANMVRNADLCINTASTMSLDALAANIPVINIAYDEYEANSRKSISRYYQYSHLNPLSASGGVYISYNRFQLINQINKVLSDPNKNLIQRRRIISKYCFNSKKSSVDTTVDMIKNNVS
jgi:hypothetical protein